MTDTPKPFTQKMWAAMNYNTIWSVGYTREMARHAFRLELRGKGITREAVDREIVRRLKDGSLSIRRCRVRVLK